jgi:polyadenylate-binding protein 2
VHNLHIDTTIDELEQLFNKFGLVNKVTMICDKYTGKSKGTAYIEFDNKDSKEGSKELNNTVYKSKLMKVNDRTLGIPQHLGRRGNYLKILVFIFNL